MIKNYYVNQLNFKFNASVNHYNTSVFVMYDIFKLLNIKNKLFNFYQISNNKNFANGRLARNLFDELVMCHARRVINIDNPNREDLSTIEVADFNISNEKEKLVE